MSYMCECKQFTPYGFACGHEVYAFGSLFRQYDRHFFFVILSQKNVFRQQL